MATENFFAVKTDPNNPFRNSTNNLYSKQLFVEWAGVDNPIAMYTLKRHTWQGKPSLYQLYMDMSDVSEYTFAKTYFEGWKHWELLTSANWFTPYITEWRAELAVKIQSEAIARIKEIGEKGGKDALTANRYIAERGWEKPSANRRGRPSKFKVDPVVLAKKLDEDRLDEDFERVMNG